MDRYLVDEPVARRDLGDAGVDPDTDRNSFVFGREPRGPFGALDRPAVDDEGDACLLVFDPRLGGPVPVVVDIEERVLGGDRAGGDGEDEGCHDSGERDECCRSTGRNSLVIYLEVPK